MDLLVQVAAANKLSPASHALQVYTETSTQPVEYKASQIIGSLHVSRVQLINKKQEKERRQSASNTKQFEVRCQHGCCLCLPPVELEGGERNGFAHVFLSVANHTFRSYKDHFVYTPSQW